MAIDPRSAPRAVNDHEGLGEMANDEPPEKPPEDRSEPIARRYPSRRKAPRAVTGQSDDHHGKGGGHHPLTPEKHEAMWQAYLKGERTIGGLARAGGCSRETANKAMTKGWADHRQWPPFRERIKLYERQTEKAEMERKRVEEAAVTEKFREQVDPVFQARKRNLAMAERVSALLLTNFEKVAQNTGPATMIRYRRALEVQKDAQGNPMRNADGTLADAILVEKAYIPLEKVTAALRANANALRDVATLERVWLKLGREDDSGLGKDGGAGDENAPPEAPITAEQLEWMDRPENHGKLPPGVSDQQLLASFQFLVGGLASPKK